MDSAKVASFTYGSAHERKNNNNIIMIVIMIAIRTHSIS